ncbi:MAG TPA: hypothetical protein VEZ12_08395 [Herpetosiphonaceae bacterium]|nr:hypothetical protein [Herpetosiphonaceae bacterium]
MKTRETELRIRERPSEPTTINIPSDTLASLKRVAATRDMSHDALIKLYIGEGLRRDLARLFSERVLETTAEVLSRHFDSEEEIAAIIAEIRDQATQLG